MLTIDQARQALQSTLPSPLRALAWLTPSGRRALGETDGSMRYTRGVGDTWEEALERAGVSVDHPSSLTPLSESGKAD